MKEVSRLIARNGGGLSGIVRLAGKGLRVLLMVGPKELILRIQRAKTLEFRLPPIPVGDSPVGPMRQILAIDDKSIDVIICVHDAFEKVDSCLRSVSRTLGSNCRVVLVDDGSASRTADLLDRYARNEGWHLIRHDQALGYPSAANAGMQASNADFVVLLNSDTVVSSEWLERLLICAQSDPSIGIVGPLSNAASWQSVPVVESDGDWATNRIPEGMSIAELAELTARYSGRVYPRVGVLNGFCMMIRRALLDQVGLFDTQTFGLGYGEENDLCLRATSMGWTLAIADDVYVFHDQTSSYAMADRIDRSRSADILLRAKHGERMVNDAVSSCRDNPILATIREDAHTNLARHHRVREARERHAGISVTFILPVAEPSGGAKVILTEAAAMSLMGVDVEVVNLEAHRSRFEHVYGHHEVRRRYFRSVEDLVGGLSERDIVVATLFTTIEWMAKYRRSHDQIIMYYVQDFEPLFFDNREFDYDLAMASYTMIPDALLITKTDWTRQMVIEHTGVVPHVVGPSVDLDLFTVRHPSRNRWPNGPLRVAAMVRPSTPRRAPQLTLNVLERLKEYFGDSLEVVLFGADRNDPAMRMMTVSPGFRVAGVLQDVELAVLFADIDLFVDLSLYQAMGLTALEALSAGVPVVVPENGGARAYAEQGTNALFANTDNEAHCLMTIEQVLTDDELRQSLSLCARRSVRRFAPEYAASNILDHVSANGIRSR